MVTVPQLETLTSIGRMKSFKDELNEFDERLLTYPRPKLMQASESKTPAAVRSIAASPKVSPGSVSPVTGSRTEAAFTEPSAKPVSGITGPQQGPEGADAHGPVAVQRDRPSVGFPPPLNP